MSQHSDSDQTKWIDQQLEKIQEKALIIVYENKNQRILLKEQIFQYELTLRKRSKMNKREILKIPLI